MANTSILKGEARKSNLGNYSLQVEHYKCEIKICIPWSSWIDQKIKAYTGE